MAEYHELDPNGDVSIILQKNAGNKEENSEAATTIRIRASSRHLILASPVFAAMLRRDGFREGAELRASGAAEVVLHDDAAPALLTALTVVHGGMSRVPRALGLSDVADIAILVDKYALYDALCLHGDLWLDDVARQHPLPSSAGASEFMPWLCAAWVFRRSSEFRALTQVAQQQWDGPLGTGAQPAIADDFPVPASILETIEEARKNTIARVLAYITATLDDYRGPARHCTHNKYSNSCDAMVLGQLQRELSRQGLYPLPSSPYYGLSFNDLASRLKKMDLTSLCDETGSSGYFTRQCGVKRAVEHTLDKLRLSLRGLELPVTA